MMLFVSAMVAAVCGNDVNLLPLGLALGAARLCVNRLPPAVNGYFFIPVAGQCLAARWRLTIPVRRVLSTGLTIVLCVRD